MARPAPPGAGQACEIIFLWCAFMVVKHRIKAGEAQRDAYRVSQNRDPTHASGVFQSPFIHDEAGRDAKADGIRQTVEFRTEFTCDVQHPRHAPIQHIEYAGDDDSENGFVPFAFQKRKAYRGQARRTATATRTIYSAAAASAAGLLRGAAAMLSLMDAFLRLRAGWFGRLAQSANTGFAANHILADRSP